MSYNYDNVTWEIKKGDLISLRQMSYEMEIEQESFGIVITDKIQREDEYQMGMFPHVNAYMFDTGQGEVSVAWGFPGRCGETVCLILALDDVCDLAWPSYNTGSGLAA